MKCSKQKDLRIFRTLACSLVLLFAGVAQAQTTAFTYQGKLTDAGNPANGNYDLQFKLFDTPTVGTGAQQGATLARNPVVVSAGVFTVTLDFGASVFTGADRYLEIGVRPAGSANPYTVLAPRQPLTSTPYAIQTLKAASADALSSACVGCVTGAQIGSLPSNSGNYIQNTASPQASSNFNISGSGTVGGSLNVNGAFPNGFFLSNGTASLRGTIVGNSVLFGTTTNNALSLSANNGVNGSLFLDTSGSIGINTIAPNHKLTIDTFGGPTWTSHGWGGAIALRNSSAIGWQFNSSNLSFGIGQSTGGLSFFRTTNSPGTSGNTPTYDLVISNQGDVGIGTTAPNAKLFVQGEASNGVGIAATGNASQSRNKGGWVKALLDVDADGSILICYNGLTGAATGNCGFSVTRVSLNFIVNFGFQVSDRFFSVTARPGSAYIVADTPNEIHIQAHLNTNPPAPTRFYLIVY